MKLAKKLFATVLAVAMLMSVGIVSFAQDVGTAAENTATITIKNAAKGETYSVYKLFDATVTGTENGSIAYTGTIPDSLSDYFTKDSAGNISVTAGVNQTELFEALATWAADETATATATSDGSTLNFVGLDYGYYVVTTTQTTTTTVEGVEVTKSAITVTSTNPNATIYDKNVTEPGPGDDEDENLKTVDDADVSIGDTVTYTIKFTTANFEGEGETAKRILSYTITDTLPEFLDDVTVTSITIDGKAYTVKNAENEDVTPQFDENGKITIPWVDADNASLYNNGAVIKITYTATVIDKVAVGGAETANANDVTINWNVEDDGDNPDPGGKPSQTSLTGSETISTYAAAIQKVDENNANLAGAQFSIKGLTVTGSKGNYTVTSYDPSDETTVTGTVMEADDNGLIVINGIASDETLVATETLAPEGYNKLTTTVDVKPVLTSETFTTTTTTTYYDADGNEVDSAEGSTSSTTVVNTLDAVKTGAQKIQNQKGTTLPTTGGMGTTLFYVIGGILVVGAGVLLITKKRMRAE